MRTRRRAAQEHLAQQLAKGEQYLGTATLTLTEFLLARIAEDEEWGRTEAEGWSGHLNDPARVLAECGAKRRIVALHGYDFYAPVDAESSWEESAQCTADREDWPCPTLRLLALLYADHPDYREEWQV